MFTKRPSQDALQELSDSKVQCEGGGEVTKGQYPCSLL